MGGMGFEYTRDTEYGRGGYDGVGGRRLSLRAHRLYIAMRSGCRISVSSRFLHFSCNTVVSAMS